MNILSIENLWKTFGLKPILSGVTFGIEDTDKVGIIGVNGCGKSTLMRILTGEEEKDSGTISLANGIRIGYLMQNPTYNDGISVLDAVYSGTTDTLQLVHDYEHICRRIAHEGDNAALLDEMTRLAAQIESAGAWELETQAKTILSKLGIDDTDAIVGTLSGGMRKRIALARALIEHPDLLILDEPTNHLDAETIEWLEDFLRRYNGALLLVTHDRYFLDRVATRILELEGGEIQSFTGGYSVYLEKKEAQTELLRIAEEKRRKLIAQELEWLRRGPKARRGKQKARIDRAHDLMAEEIYSEQEDLEITVPFTRLGRKIVELHAIRKQYGERVIIGEFSYTLMRRDRIGIIGPNGSGKTTLLDCIAGMKKIDSGRIDTGDTVVFGYYDQESRPLNENQKVIDYVKEGAEIIRSGSTTITAAQMLERFLFPDGMHYTPIGMLSGGERRRLYLLRVLMGAPNVLILDEPTNDLDISTLQALENYLEEFPGCLIVVSHDRYFLDRTVEHVFRFEGEGVIREYPGNYSAFLEYRNREQQELKERDRAPKKERVKEKEEGPRKLSYKERKEMEALERSIEKAEARKNEIGDLLTEHASDYEKVKHLYDELNALEAKLEEDMTRWAELAEYA